MNKKKKLLPDYHGPRLPPEVQLKRVLNVIENELTPKQKQMITMYFFEEKTMPEIAQELGIHKSSVCRCINRAISRIQKYLKY